MIPPMLAVTAGNLTAITAFALLAVLAFWAAGAARGHGRSGADE